MLESFEYVLAWVVYFAAAVGVMAVWWRITRYLPWLQLRQLLRVLVAAALLVPAPVSSLHPDWAPAIFVLLFDMTLVEQRDPLRGLAYLLYAQALGLCVLLADSLLRRFLKSKSVKQPNLETEHSPA